MALGHSIPLLSKGGEFSDHPISKQFLSNFQVRREYFFCRYYSWLVIAYCLVVAIFVSHAQIRSGAWLDVPFVKQEKNLCGAACVAMVMQYWAKSLKAQPSGIDDEGSIELPSFSEIANALKSSRTEGVYGSEMGRYFEAKGFQAFILRAEWADLEHHLNLGRPLIVALGVNKGNGLQHFVVLAGWDPEEELVLINDPARRKLLKANRASFEASWNQTSNWTLLAVPQIPQKNTVTLSNAR